MLMHDIEVVNLKLAESVGYGLVISCRLIGVRLDHKEIGLVV